jgi:AraC-like DNA-binding protein
MAAMRAIGDTSGWTWEFAQLANGLLNVERDVVPFEDGCIASISVDRACLHQVRADWGCNVILLPAPESGAVYIEGRRLVAGEAVLLPPAGKMELLTHAVGRIFLIALPGLRAASRTRNRPGWYTRAGNLSEVLRAWLETSSSAIDSQPAAALQARLLSWMKSALLAAQRPGAEGPALPRRRMAVERVRCFIHEHLAESMTLADLCRHAHLQARSLEYGFRDLVGLSPFKYIKMLRLGEVRRRLQTSSASQLSVSEAALDCGFSHLSQFAADYKQVFLESPSATSRASEYPRVARVARYDSTAAVAAAR